MMSSRTMKAAALTLAAALAFGPEAGAAEVKIRLGWATTDLETDAYNFAARAFGAALEEAKPGHFEVAYYPNRTLGDEKDMLQGIQLGTVDSAIITNPIIANVDPSYTINDLPFLYPSSAKVYEVLDGPLGDELFDRVREKKIVGLAWCESGFRNMINRTHPIYTPDDVKGMKFRVIENPLFVGMFTLLDAGGVPMPFGEVFTALQQGTIDGMESPTWSLWANKMTEAADYVSMSRHIYSTAPILMSAKFYDGLSAEDQGLVKAAAQQACVEQRAFSQDYEAKVIELMKANGVQVNEIEDPAAFQVKMQPLYDEYREKIGADIMDRWLAAVRN